MFTYRPLSREKPEIRLVRFVDMPQHSDLDETPIHFQICHASLEDSETEYAALSYAWGDITKTVEIYIEASPFNIGHNLHNALVELRRAKTTSWLWFDSVCIQQSDMEEKTSQVGYMGTIYRQAKLLHVWLGPGCEETDKTMDWISSVGTVALSSGIFELWTDPNAKEEIRGEIKSLIAEQSLGTEGKKCQRRDIAQFALHLIREPGLQKDSYLLDGIRNLMRRDYWHRIWIIQEIALGKETTVMCGTRRVSLDKFDAILMSICFCDHIAISLRPIFGDLLGTCRNTFTKA